MSHWVHDRQKAHHWKGQPWQYAQEKLDGFRVTAFRQPEGCKRPVLIYPRRAERHLEFVERFPRIQHETWYKKLLDLPPLTSIDAEIIVPNGRSSDVPRALRDPAFRLRFIPFALPFFEGEDTGSLTLPEAADRIKDMGLSFASFLHREELNSKAVWTVMKKELLTLASARSIEGWVLKTSSHYGKWYKVKAERTVDCIVTDTKEGKGKYEGMIGALLVSVYDGKQLVEIARCSGMTDEQRVCMGDLDNKGKLQGRVCEVEYQQVEARGRLRHPRFVCWREDKPAKECTIDQIQDGEE